MTRESWPVAVSSLVSRNRRRYRGYGVHVGIAVLFLGVAASSAFHDQADARLLPGQSTKVGDYTVQYVRQTARPGDDRDTGALMSLGAELRVTKDGETWTMHPSRNYYGSPSEKGPFSGVFDGESTSEVSLRWGAKQDFWLAVQPDLRNVRKAIDDADRKFPKADAQTQGVIVMAILSRYMSQPVEMPVRAIVSPMVAWIWVGGAIALCGSLLALWPAPSAKRREVASAYKARLGRELTTRA